MTVSISTQTFGLYSQDVCSLFAGKWFVSTGKDNLLNAWRTPYGASIFQVTKINTHTIQPNSIKGHYSFHNLSGLKSGGDFTKSYQFYHTQFFKVLQNGLSPINKRLIENNQ